MSFLLKSTQFSYLSNKEKEDFLLSDDDGDDDFNFKYFPVHQFKNVVKNVRRQKIKMDEERVWASFVRQQEVDGSSNGLDSFNPSTMHNMKHFLRDSIDEVDRELKRLQEDTRPEISKMPYKGIGVKNHSESQSMNMTQQEPQNKVPVMKDSGTGSTNILLTIPEEENTNIASRKSPKIRQGSRISTKKSSSDHMVLKRDHSRKLLHIMDDSEYNSSPEASPDRLSERGDAIFVRPDPVVAHKVLAIQKKISTILNEISFRLDRIPLPDGDRDLSRRQQRVVEFSIRFSRNYLYDLGRQVTDIQRHIRTISPNARPKPTRRGVAFHIQVIGQKLITAHQMLLQALGAYCKHIPSSVLRGHPGKLKEILQVVMDLKDICFKINLTTEYFGSGDADVHPLGNETQKKCSIILSKLQLKGLGSDNESQLISHTTQSTLAAAPPSSQSKKRGKHKRLSSRLSMYSMESHLPKSHPSRRSNACFQREKKYAANTKLLSDNPPPTPEQPNPSPATYKSSKETVRNAAPKVRLPPREDDIRTMMDMMPADSDAGSSVETILLSKPKSIDLVACKSKMLQRLPVREGTPSRANCCKESQNFNNNELIVDEQELAKKVTMITDEHLSSLVPVIAELMSLVTNKKSDFEVRPVSSASMETLLGFLQKYQPPQGPSIKLTSHKPDSPKETRSGAKNMQLICLPSKENEEEKLECSDVSCQVNHGNYSGMSNSVAEMKIEEAKKSIVKEKDTVQLVVPTAADNLIPLYHEEYHCFTQSSPMYMSNTHNKPWDMVAWIADRLVDELVAEISKELQMDSIIKKLFDLEFQEF